MRDKENVRIQDDLYEYVNGEWLSKAIIPDDRPTTGGFADLAQGVEKTLMADFKEFACGNKTSDVQTMDNAIKLYKKVLDVEERNKSGIKPVTDLLNKIKGITDINKFNELAYELSFEGMPLAFTYGVDADMKDATVNSFVINGPSIILPDTTYYGNSQGEKLLEIYSDMANKALSYTDLTEEERKQYLEDTLCFDNLIAKKVKSQLEWADYVKNYNPMDLNEVCSYLKPFDFETFLRKIYGDKIPNTIIVYDPKAIKEMNYYFNETNLQLYVHWAYVKTLLKAAHNLSEELYEIATIYQRALTGIAANPTLEKRAYQIASSIFSQPVGLYYGKTYFGPEAKEDITAIVKKIIETYQKRIENNTFLQEPTKKKAILKLSKINIKMGYPDRVEDIYKKLKINEEDSYYQTIVNISKVIALDELEQLHKPVDKNKWLMPGHMVNACYDPNRNDITFPAAILQKPFYSYKQSISENLGGIGTVIAHEISHAFDNNGAHFDENGNLYNWWSAKDLSIFEELTKKMVDQWDKIEYHNQEVNGQLVVSENIADNGGMAVTLQIMHETPETDFKKYFINWAKIWCLKAKEEYILLLLKNDVHSPAKLRANIQVRNFKEWYETFDVKPSDKMYIAPDKRIIIW